MASAAEGLRPGSRAERWGLFGILLVAAALRALAWQRTAVLFNDGPIFLAMAEAILDGRWAEVLAHVYHPLYPAGIALVALLPVGLETAAVGVSIAGGVLAVAAIFWFVRAHFDLELAWISAWVVALHPWAVDFSADVMSDGLYMGLFLVAFAAMADLVRWPATRRALVFGVAVGAAYLTRPEGAGLIAVAMCLMIVRAVKAPELRRSVVRAGLAAGLAAACVMGPLVGAVGLRTGELSLTQKKSIAQLAGIPDARHDSAPEVVSAPRPPDPARVEAGLPVPESAIRSDGRGERLPPRNLMGVAEASWRVLSTSFAAMRYEVMLWLGIGLWALTRGRVVGPHGPVAAIGLTLVTYSALLWLLVWGAGYVSRRHALPFWLPALPVAAIGWRVFLHGVEAWGSRPGGGRAAGRTSRGRVVLLVLVIGLVLGWGARDLRPRRMDREPVRRAAEWLARAHPESGPVAAQKRRTAYYAGARYVPLPPGHDGRLERNLRRRGTRWVIIDESKLEDHRGLAEGVGDWLGLAHTVASGDSRILVLEVI